MSITSDEREELRDRHEFDAELCPVARTLEVVGTRSAMLMMREAFYGTRRFDDFAKRVGVTDQVAATRLKALVEDGLLQRKPYQEPGQRTRWEYRLTDKGRDLFPVLVALRQWGDTWSPGPDGPLAHFTHRGCDAPITAEVRCTTGHDVPVREVAVVAGPRPKSKA